MDPQQGCQLWCALTLLCCHDIIFHLENLSSDRTINEAVLCTFELFSYLEGFPATGPSTPHWFCPPIVLKKSWNTNSTDFTILFFITRMYPHISSKFVGVQCLDRCDKGQLFGDLSARSASFIAQKQCLDTNHSSLKPSGDDFTNTLISDSDVLLDSVFLQLKLRFWN